MKALLLLVLLSSNPCFSQAIEIVKLEAEVPDSGRAWAVSFCLEGKFYYGSGFNGATLTNDFWCYDPKSTSWSQVADLPGAPRDDAFSFDYGDKAYIGLGICAVDDQSVMGKDVWSYDPEKDEWERMNNFPGSGRLDPFVFNLADRIFLGAGRDSIRVGKFLNDLWEYDVENDSWTQRNDLPFTGRFRTVEFIYGMNAYVGLGQGEGAVFNDLWMYDLENDSWTEKNKFPTELVRLGTVCFNYSGDNYVGLGTNGQTWFKDIYKYNQSEDSWSKAGEIPGEGRGFSVASSTGKAVLIGTGYVPNKFLGDWFVIGTP